MNPQELSQDSKQQNGTVHHATSLVKSLRLQNFGLFEDQRIDFPDGITLLTGPNGSGKSTILNGIILALGGNPVKGKTSLSLGEFIGKNKAKPAVVTLVLRNPMVPGATTRLFPLDQEEIIIEREIHAKKLMSGEMGYSSKWKLNKKRSNQGDIQDLFKHLEKHKIILDPLNPLTFVKEHSIDLLVSMPNTEKFAVFAELLGGLKTAADNYVQAQEHLNTLKGVLKKKQQQLHLIKKELSTLEDLKKQYEHKLELEHTLEELDVEEQWSKYFQSIHEYKQVFLYIQELENDIKEYQKEIQSLHARLEEVDRELKIAQEQENMYNGQVITASQAAQRISRQYQGLVEQKQMKQTQIRSIMRRLNAHVEKLQRLGYSLDQAREILNQQETQIQQELVELETRKKAITQQMIDLAEQIRKLRLEIETRERVLAQYTRELEDLTEPQRGFQQEITSQHTGSQRNPSFMERGKIRDTLKVHQFIMENNIHDAWVVFKHIFIHPQYWKYMYALNWALRYKHFDIVTTSIETRNILVDYRRTHDLEITIAYSSSNSFNQEYKPINYTGLSPEERSIIIGTVYDMIHCPVPEVKDYVVKELQGVIVKPTRNELLERLQRKLKRDIFVQHDTILEHYTRSYNRSVKLHSIHMVLSELPFASQDPQNEEEQGDAMRKIELESKIMTLQEEILAYREQLIPLIEEQDTLVAIKTKINRDLEKYRRENTRFASEEVKQIIAKIYQEYERDREQLRKQEQALEDIDTKISGLQGELEELRENVNRIKDDLLTTQQTQQNLKNEAENLKVQQQLYENQIKKIKENIKNEQMKLQVKEKLLSSMLLNLPLHPKFSSQQFVRPLSQILNEKQQVSNEIKNIHASKQDQERYEKVKQELQELQEQVDDVLGLIEETQPKYKERFDTWIKAVREFEENLEKVTNALLHPYLHVHLELRNVNTPSKTELRITYITRIDAQENAQALDPRTTVKEKKKYRDFKMASGGEQVLIIMALILSTYEVSKQFFPVRIIDEFGQRLDPLKKTIALEMVRKSISNAQQRVSFLQPQLILASPIISNLELPSDVHQRFLLVVELNKGKIKETSYS